MKRILAVLATAAVVLSTSAAWAQTKTPAEARKALDAAVAASQNDKKATKAATWQKLGQAYMAAYEAPAGSVWRGASKQELMYVMGSEKPVSTEEVVISGQPMTKEVYADKNLYFNAYGQVDIIEVTRPVEKDALDKALEAYSKCLALDPKKAKDIGKEYEKISSRYMNDAFNAYQLGDVKLASALFEKAGFACDREPVNKIDTSAVYNAGFTAIALGEKERAQKLLEKCYEMGYYSDGEVYAKLAEVDTLNTRKYLEEGFAAFPQSQSILIGLINYYLTHNESPDRLFELLDMAKVNEPNNASLYYVEGNIHGQLGQIDEAVASYRKCSEINPQYEYGYIGEGVLFYNKAIEVQTKAQEEMDDNKYMALVAEFEKDLKACIEPFEKAYSVSKDNAIRVNIAEYLKNAFYRFRDQDPSYQAGYDKYNEVVKSGEAK